MCKYCSNLVKESCLVYLSIMCMVMTSLVPGEESPLDSSLRVVPEMRQFGGSSYSKSWDMSICQSHVTTFQWCHHPLGSGTSWTPLLEVYLLWKYGDYNPSRSELNNSFPSNVKKNYSVVTIFFGMTER